MGSVENLGRRLWSAKANGKGGDVSAAFQIRLDLTSDQHLTRLSATFGIPKATLGQELLRAALNDLILSNPYTTSRDVMSAQELADAGLSGDEIATEPGSGRPLLKDEA